MTCDVKQQRCSSSQEKFVLQHLLPIAILPRGQMLSICQIKRSRDFTCAIFGILACHDQIKKVSASSIHTRGDMPPNSLPPNTTVCSSHYVRLPNVFPILYNRSRCFVLSNILFLILPIVSNLAWRELWSDLTSSVCSLAVEPQAWELTLVEEQFWADELQYRQQATFHQDRSHSN